MVLDVGLSVVVVVLDVVLDVVLVLVQGLEVLGMVVVVFEFLLVIVLHFTLLCNDITFMTPITTTGLT